MRDDSIKDTEPEGSLVVLPQYWFKSADTDISGNHVLLHYEPYEFGWILSDGRSILKTFEDNFENMTTKDIGHLQTIVHKYECGIDTNGNIIVDTFQLVDKDSPELFKLRERAIHKIKNIFNDFLLYYLQAYNLKPEDYLVNNTNNPDPRFEPVHVNTLDFKTRFKIAINIILGR